MTISQERIAVQPATANLANRQVSSFVPVAEEIAGSSLDLFSISQTRAFCEQTYAVVSVVPQCVNNAPYFAMKLTEKSYGIVQGCCNDWNCPKCGIQRAKQEYGRIVEGCRQIAAKHQIYFITLTCRGADLTLQEAEDGYLTWTNRLLTAFRTRARRDKKDWTYVQVTERQKRGHPHSHVLTTFYPHDLRDGHVEKWTTDMSGNRVKKDVPALRSDWIEARCISAGLGNQYDISRVDTVEGASRYVAKYLFKASMFSTQWQKSWRRVRYSQSFPKLPEMKSDAMVLVTDDDWQSLASKALIITPKDTDSHAKASFMLRGHDIILRQPKNESE